MELARNSFFPLAIVANDLKVIARHFLDPTGGGLSNGSFNQVYNGYWSRILELWAAIPAGTALRLHPLLNGIASALGAIIGAVLIIFFGDRLCMWLLRKKEKSEKNKGRIYKIWEKYGVIGLGMLSPLITGAPLGAAIGISLGASPKRLII